MAQPAHIINCIHGIASQTGSEHVQSSPAKVNILSQWLAFVFVPSASVVFDHPRAVDQFPGLCCNSAEIKIRTNLTAGLSLSSFCDAQAP